MSSGASVAEPEAHSSIPNPIGATHGSPNESHGRENTHQTAFPDQRQLHKAPRDPALDVNLPYRTLNDDAHLDEYTTERSSGEIPTRHPQNKESDYRLVTFLPGDAENPKNWSKVYKWWCTMVVAFTCFVVAFASSIITADLIDVEDEFGKSEEVVLLSVTVFVIGFGVGPMVFAPLSEIFGRRVIYAPTLLIAALLIIPCAMAKSISTLLGGTLADLWTTEDRGVPMAAFSAAPFLGPAIGPLVGGFLSDAAGWRWLYWLQLILSGIAAALITFTVPETYAPVILARRARQTRKRTGDASYVTEQDLDLRPLRERLRIFLIRPFQLLFGELIVFLISLYMSVLYGLLYMFFIAYPIIYQKGKGYSAGITGLMFIPIALGVLCSAMCAPLVNRHYLSQCQKHKGSPPAEVRLVPMMVSCWLIPVGLFIFAWSSYPRLSWAGPAIAGFPVGFGFIFLYNSANNYLVDSYQHQAASALAAKTFIRSFWGAAVVLFTAQMYDRLGFQWASSLLGFISLGCCAIPYAFYFYGARIRARSKYAYSGDDEENAK
ncbi:hypothetical protein NQ176_g2098 [Zarea fungicola]|uniref:Uncharacterized protein n=1 Tax=Zarea fungicola TaxID=93591 RepID=A0ACC1NQX5_9HYPO|nr:hypothetical protein NQ176_g2098 [Lecanicillium fungicola]